jgi:hypothetical protein
MAGIAPALFFTFFLTVLIESLLAKFVFLTLIF